MILVVPIGTIWVIIQVEKGKIDGNQCWDVDVQSTYFVFSEYIAWVSSHYSSNVQADEIIACTKLCRSNTIMVTWATMLLTQAMTYGLVREIPKQFSLLWSSHCSCNKWSLKQWRNRFLGGSLCTKPCHSSNKVMLEWGKINVDSLSSRVG